MMRRQLLFGPVVADAEVVVAAGAQDAFLSNRQFGKGHVLLFSVPADRTWTDLPLSPFFLPIVYQVVQYSSGLADGKHFDWTARTLALTDVMPDVQDGTSLLTPGGNRLAIRRIRKETNTEVVVENAMEPGVYRMAAKEGGGTQPALALNVARRESDVTTLKTDEITEMLGVKKLSVTRTKDDLMRLIKENRIGRPMSEAFLWVALLLATLELLVSNRASRKTATLSEHLSIEKSGRVKGKG